MDLSQDALDHYKSFIDSAETPEEREELLTGIEQHHATDNYLVTDKAELRGFGQKALGTFQPEQSSQNILQSLGRKDAAITASGGDTLTGLKRGVQNLQAMNYGALALAGKGLKSIGLDSVGQSAQDFGMEGYRRNVEEAKQYPKRHSFKDVYTGEAGIGGTVDWIQGTLGELVPSMAEAAVGALLGASVGSAVAPGAGTVGGGFVGGFTGRTVLKTAIEKGVQQAIKKGIGTATESQLRAQITKQAMKKLGGKVGMGAAVMPMESGGMYAELLEEKGIDAPETALFFGALATSLEFFGGNSKLIDTFVDALSTGSKSVAKKTAKELLTNIPQEALQEGGQEALGILNKVVNTDEEFFTAENIEQIIEGMGAGAVGGGAGAVVSGGLNTQNDVVQDKITERFENIKAQGNEKIPASITALDQEVIQNNQILQNKETLDQAQNLEDEKTAFDEYVPKLPLKETSSFINEQQIVEPTQVDVSASVVPMKEIEASLSVVEQQLDILTTQINTETDTDARMALQQESSTLYEQQAILQSQWQAQYQEQDQITLPEAGAEFQTSVSNRPGTKVSITDIAEMFPHQEVVQAEDGSVAVRFKNGKGVTFHSIHEAGQGFVRMAIDTGQMSKNGKILGITVGSDVLLDADFADNKTMWHENKHVLDNLGMITEADNSMLNKEFNKLQKSGKLDFALSTHENPVQRMKENRANMFAQIMTDRAAYRNKPLGKVIQRVMDFFQKMLAFGKQSVSGLAQETESGALYNREVGQEVKIESDTNFQTGDMKYSVADQVLAGLINKKTATNTPEFAKWFDQSVAKTKEGEPLVFYHGTDGVFDTFTKDQDAKSGHASAGLGHFFTMKKGLADKYGQHVMPMYLKMKKPYKMSLQESQSFASTTASAQRQEELKAEGYDSVIIETGAAPYVIIFDSGQAKSIHNQGEWKDPENVYFETREQVDQPTQKLSDSEYLKRFKQSNNKIQNIFQTAKIRGFDAKLLLDKLFGATSTRLNNAYEGLGAKVRELDFNTSQSIIKSLKVARPLLEATKEMSTADRHAFDSARRQADTVKVNQIAEKYGMLEDMEKFRDTLNNIRQEARKVGYDVGFIDEYWPRIIKDQEGFLQAIQKISQRADFTEAFKVKAKEMGITLDEFNREFPEIKADMVSNMILGRTYGIGGPGNIQGRVYETVPEKLEKFYMNSDAALMQYIFSMTKKIEARKFFGKVPPTIAAHKAGKKKASLELIQLNARNQVNESEEINQIMADQTTALQDRITLHEEALNKYKNQEDYTENIGAYINDLITVGKLKQKDEHVVRTILNARFNEHGATGAINAYKNMAYIDVMGNPLSAITQIGDLAWAAYVGKAWTPKGFSRTVKHAINASLNKSKITKENLGLERIAQEFADGTTMGSAVDFVFKKVGLTKIDSIGKETLINNALLDYQDQVKTPEGIAALKKKIRPIFGAKTDQVIQDLSASNINDSNVTDNVKLLLYSRLLDFQPAALSEMPELYLRGGNGRVFYMLKTYTIKQMDVFRNEVFHDLQSKDPQRIMTGMSNMVKLLAVLTLANAGADELKDLVLGKELKFSDHLIENFLTIGGASKYMQMQVTREGVGSALMQKILPPMKFADSVSQDLNEKITTGDVANYGRVLDSMPFAGKLAYWHWGRGAKNKKTIEEQDFKKASKRFRKFKQQFEKAPDKRLFLQTNSGEFKQMKLHQNIQSALSRNKAAMNKLEKLDQTPAITKRLGQLENQRRIFIDNYFKAAENLNTE